VAGLETDMKQMSREGELLLSLHGWRDVFPSLLDRPLHMRSAILFT